MIYFVEAAFVVTGCAVACAGLIVLLRPWLDRYALARPNERSLHVSPTAEGGGIAVMLAVMLGCAGAAWFGLAGSGVWRLVWLLPTAAMLALVGMLDDFFQLPVIPRLIAQTTAAYAALLILPDDARIFPSLLPVIVERAALLLGLVWFINLTNFMDGMDWMTVAEVVPITGALGLFWVLGWLPDEAGVLALALLGAMLGFAPFNRHKAGLFLGDVGSLPIGLLLGWALIAVAVSRPAAAILLPLYYVADATLTLIRRLASGRTVWRAHREHFYQWAAAQGMTAPQIVQAVFLVNLGLAALAAACFMTDALWVQLVCLLAGAALVAWLLNHLNRAPR